MSTLAPRAVVVTRPSELDQMLARHGTRGQVEFFLRTRGRTLAQVDEAHELLADAVRTMTAAVPADWRRASVSRPDLPTFAFTPEDVVVVVGQDGLVANVAKYVGSQPVFGVNPDPRANAGVLVPMTPAVAARALVGRPAFRSLTMARAVTDDGQELCALNEIFFGHPSHQSARYTIQGADRSVPQSSSGLIAATGTGATGWAASIRRERHSDLPLPRPDERALAWFAREPWPGPGLDADTTEGLVTDELVVTCTSDQLVLFADGLENDRIAVTWGQDVRIGCARRSLQLAQP
ncbi:NAD(+)/NADH kinase [Nocardioides maradonensis]